MRDLLREYVKGVLLEITKLPQEYFGVIDDAVMASQFWALPNDDEDDPDAEGVGATPAAMALQGALQQAMDDVGLDIDVVVSSYFTGDTGYMLHPDHPAYPNRWLVDARWYVSKRNPGRNTIDLMLMLADEDSGFDISDVDPPSLMKHITQTVRHELVHYTQMKKQAANKDLDDMSAFQEMLDDPSQVPSDDNPKYWEVYESTGQTDEDGNEIINKEGYKHAVFVKDYLSSHIEIDAHAHDGAEDLLDAYGYDGALDALRGEIKTDDPKMPNALKHYFEYLPAGDSTLDKFKSKLYSYIQHFSGKS